MPTEAASIVEGRGLRLAGDVLWLVITAGVCAVIVGIVCWSLSAELSSDAAAGRPVAAVIPETSTGSAAALPSSTFGIDRAAPSALSSTMADASSGSVPTTGTEPADVKSSLRDSPAVRLPNQPLSDLGVPAPTTNGPQSAQSVLAPPASHSPGPHRPPQTHQRNRGSGARDKRGAGAPLATQ
jgi:hypothetical protein